MDSGRNLYKRLWPRGSVCICVLLYVCVNIPVRELSDVRTICPQPHLYTRCVCVQILTRPSTVGRDPYSCTLVHLYGSGAICCMAQLVARPQSNDRIVAEVHPVEAISRSPIGPHPSRWGALRLRPTTGWTHCYDTHLRLWP